MKKLLFICSLLLTINVFAGDGTKENPFTISEAIVEYNNLPNSKYWVEGYIYDYCMNHKTNNLDTIINTMIVITEIDGDTTVYMLVQLQKGVARDNLNILDHPENIGKKVKVYGTLEKYYGIPGIKGVSKADHYVLESITTHIVGNNLSYDTIYKVLKDGSLVIIRGGTEYNVLGTVIK